jgi:hypothetical protein
MFFSFILDCRAGMQHFADCPRGHFNTRLEAPGDILKLCLNSYSNLVGTSVYRVAFACTLPICVSEAARVTSEEKG